VTDADGLDAETFESAHTLERSWDVSFISLPAFANVASWLSTTELIAQSNGRFAIRKRTFAATNLNDRFGWWIQWVDAILYLNDRRWSDCDAAEGQSSAKCSPSMKPPARTAYRLGIGRSGNALKPPALTRSDAHEICGEGEVLFVLDFCTYPDL